MLRILVVGQIPPPFHGQAIMINYLVHAKYKNIEIEHIRMDFSAAIEDIGQFSFRKLLELFRLIAQVYRAALFKKVDYLYYPPAGPNRIPMLRDITFLVSCRWLFKRTIFHFHAGGISTLYSQLPRILQYFYRLAYFKPDLSIIPSTFNPRDDQFFQSHRSVEIPYGIPDHPHKRLVRDNAPLRILYVSALFKSKGILDLLSAASLLRLAGDDFRVDVIGGFESREFENECLLFLSKYRLQDCVFFHGVKTGGEKWKYYDNADIFCFPSYYESESFGIVLLEAMQYGLPSVATRWRGIQSIVQHNKTGFLVTPQSPEELADKLALLLKEDELRRDMGLQARERFEHEYGLQTWIERMELAISQLDSNNGKC